MNMLHRLPAMIRRRPGRAVTTAVGIALVVAMAPAAASLAAPARATVSPNVHGPAEKLPNVDLRSDGSAKKVLAARSADIAAHPTAGVKALRKQLGVQGLVDIDPLTRTARRVAKLNGFLTAASSKPAKTIAMDYLRSHADVFGLNSTQVSGLQLRQDYVDIAGTHHLSFVQTVGAVPVFGNGVKAHVAKDGRLIQIDGSPVPSLPASVGAPGLSAAQARSAAVADTFGDSTAAITKASTTGDHATQFAAATRPRWSSSRPWAGPGWPGRR